MCEVYKAQRQLRPIQLKISLVAIQDFTQDLVIFYILSCMMCEDV